MALPVGPAAWLSNSLEHRAKELRKMSQRCANAYKLGHMRAAAGRLANTYAKAAACFEEELENLKAEREPGHLRRLSEVANEPMTESDDDQPSSQRRYESDYDGDTKAMNDKPSVTVTKEGR